MPDNNADYLDGLRAANASTPGSEEAIEVQSDGQVLVVETHLLKMIDDELQSSRRPPIDLPRIDIPQNHPMLTTHAYPCASTFCRTPPEPSQWPQAPIMMRPTPGSSTRIRGIRYSNEREYRSPDGFCAGCMLPLNTGTERPGRSLVIDFETPLFVGTVMVRVLDVPRPTTIDEDYQSASYFDGKKRRFQVAIKGKFIKPLPMSRCVTGQSFDRPAGRLPARFIVLAVIRLISSLAPQLEATFGSHPRFLTPLVATAHTVAVRDYQEPEIVPRLTAAVDERLANYQLYAGSLSMEEELFEPLPDDPHSVLGTVGTTRRVTTPVAARTARKKHFNALAAKQIEEPCFDTDKEYTFEFCQHMLLLATEDEFKIDAGFTTIALSPTLDGQPLKIFAAHKHPETGRLEPLWSLDLWHQSLFAVAQEYDATTKARG